MGKDLKGKDLGIGVIQRKDGRYMYRYKDHMGKSCTRYANTEREIRTIKRDIEYELEHGAYSNSGEITLNSWFEFWIDKKKRTVKNRTVELYSYYYNMYIKNTIGMLYMDSINPVMCREMLDKLSDSGIADTSVYMVKSVINQLYNEAYYYGKDVRNPIVSRITYSNNYTKSEKIALTEYDERDFLEYAENTVFYNAFALALETGLRVGELMALSVKNIDLRKRILKVERTLEYVKDRNMVVFDTPKTRCGKRIVPLTDFSVGIIMDQLQKMKNAKSTRPEFDDLLFRNRNGNALCHRELNRACKRIMDKINSDRLKEAEELGIEYVEFPNMHMHICRHTFATKCVRYGMKPEFLQRIMGHSKLSTTLDYYVHLDDDDLVSEMERILPLRVSKVCQIDMSTNDKWLNPNVC